MGVDDLQAYGDENPQPDFVLSSVRELEIDSIEPLLRSFFARTICSSLYSLKISQTKKDTLVWKEVLTIISSLNQLEHLKLDINTGSFQQCSEFESLTPVYMTHIANLEIISDLTITRRMLRKMKLPNLKNIIIRLPAHYPPYKPEASIPNDPLDSPLALRSFLLYNGTVESLHIFNDLGLGAVGGTHMNNLIIEKCDLFNEPSRIPHATLASLRLLNLSLDCSYFSAISFLRLSNTRNLQSLKLISGTKSCSLIDREEIVHLKSLWKLELSVPDPKLLINFLSTHRVDSLTYLDLDVPTRLAIDEHLTTSTTWTQFLKGSAAVFDSLEVLKLRLSTATRPMAISLIAASRNIQRLTLHGIDSEVLPTTLISGLINSLHTGHAVSRTPSLRDLRTLNLEYDGPVSKTQTDLLLRPLPDSLHKAINLAAQKMHSIEVNLNKMKHSIYK